ncbi:hypothetical protein [Nonomuraea dietziae]|uniref:hypothetical protein n=1 Tax=Nonomuraea dietziae TaxID=65515 RepID=UPI0031CFA24A
MRRQRAHRAVRREYTTVLASRESDAAPMLSRVVGKHCESGDIVVRDHYLPADLGAGRPARRGRDGRLLQVAAPATTTTCPSPPSWPSRRQGARHRVQGETRGRLLRGAAVSKPLKVALLGCG